MDERTDQPAPKRINPISDVIDAACRLASNEMVGSVHIISSRRPTYDELLHFRYCADDHHLDLIVDAAGIMFRPHREAGDAGAHHVSAAVEWLRVHGAMWRAELSAMSEGTR